MTGRTIGHGTAAVVAIASAVALVGATPALAARCDGHRANISGTKGDDNLRGTGKSDVIQAKSGDDLIRGLVLLVESDVHEPVNLGNPDEMSLLEMAKLVVELTESRSEIVFEALPVDDPQVRQPDITRARDLLGWEPEIDVRDGIARTIEHYSKILGQAATR